MTKEEKAVHILDLFTKTWCIKSIDESCDDLLFECSRCPFEDKKTGKCSVKVFKGKMLPSYENFGSMYR